MSYVFLAELKAYLGITGIGDDALLEAAIAAAQATIDRYTDRTFEASEDVTRHYCVGRDTHGRTLFLDRDLCQITSIVTDADASGGGTELTTADYITRPRNDPPYYEIVLRAGSDASWTYSDDPEDGITVTGRWGWSVTPPADIVQACKRLAAYLYKQKDAQVFDVTAQVATGAVTIRHEMPGDVRALLEPYVRRV